MLRPAKALSPIKWACQGLLAEEFKGRDFDETVAMLAKTGALISIYPYLHRCMIISVTVLNRPL